MADVLITPASGKIDFKDSGGNVDATIQLDGSGNLAITNPGGNTSIGSTFFAEKGVPVRITGGNNVTLALTDNGKLIRCVNSTSAMNIHIPTNATVAFPLGAEIAFVNELTSATANTLGFSKAAGVTLYSKANANTIADRYTAASLKKLDTNIWLLIGNIS